MLNEIKASGSIYDVVRRKYLSKLAEKTGRNVIAYYSGWLQKPDLRETELNDADITGFMNAVYGLEPEKGLDLLLHTPGGGVAAVEALGNYLRLVFGSNIRVIVPQLALSAGTMLACVAKNIMMARHSSLGPIDPHLSGLPAAGIVEEFNRAHREIAADQTKAYVWQPIINKYPPTLLGQAERAFKWAQEIVEHWLLSGDMFSDLDAERKQQTVKTIIAELADHTTTKSHDRHIPYSRAKEIGLKITLLEEEKELLDLVLSIHHAFMHTFSSTPAFKIVENHNGIAYISLAQSLRQN